MKIRVGSFLDFSTVDYPGHVTFMLFCSGCNFRCPFCQNASLVAPDAGGSIELEVIEERISASLGFLDAMGFTGGEPTLQPKPIIALCEWAKAKGLKTFLNTNGSKPRFLEEVTRRELIDYVAMDVKAPFQKERYQQVTGLKRNVARIITDIQESIAICEGAGLPLELRTTIVPTLIDDAQSIREIAEAISGYGIYVLQEYFPFEGVPDVNLRREKPPNRELMIRLTKIALKAGVKQVYIRTRSGGLEKI